jgi:GNAT superfamily N-acetyltransferase
MISIRAMAVNDIERVAALSAQLGYPVSAADVQQRWQRINQKIGNACLVAVDASDHVIGWIHVHEIDRLETVLYAEIGGLVVDEAVRKQGVGKLLMSAAESWVLEQGYPLVRLSSGLHRTDAHRFYEHIGYHNIRTAYWFEKVLPT